MVPATRLRIFGDMLRWIGLGPGQEEELRYKPNLRTRLRSSTAQITVEAAQRSRFRTAAESRLRCTSPWR
jgi:hypothetical protein